MECPNCQTVWPDHLLYCGQCGNVIDPKVTRIISSLESTFNTKLAEISKRQMDTQKQIEFDMTERVANRLIGWAKLFAVPAGLLITILLAFLAYFGIKDFNHFNQLEARLEQLTTRADSLDLLEDSLSFKIHQSDGTIEQITQIQNSVNVLVSSVSAINDTLQGTPLDTSFESKYLKGIDISRFQKVENWEQVSKHVSFVFMKATEGVRKDSDFLSNWQNATKVGVIKGAYHVIKFDTSVKLQAQKFIETVRDHSINDLPPVLVVEDMQEEISTKDCENMINEWIKEVQRAFGTQPIIYTGKYYWSRPERMKDSKKFKDIPLWTAKYGKTYDVYGGWTRPTFWQYSDLGRVEGINGVTSLNYFLGNMADLKKFIQAQRE